MAYSKECILTTFKNINNFQTLLCSTQYIGTRKILQNFLLKLAKISSYLNQQ